LGSSPIARSCFASNSEAVVETTSLIRLRARQKFGFGERSAPIVEGRGWQMIAQSRSITSGLRIG